MANLIAPTKASATSGDIVLAANTNPMFSLIGTVQPYGTARIEKKGSDGSYMPMPGGVLNTANTIVVLPVYNTITIRVTKDDSAQATGVDQD